MWFMVLWAQFLTSLSSTTLYVSPVILERVREYSTLTVSHSRENVVEKWNTNLIRSLSYTILLRTSIQIRQLSTTHRSQPYYLFSDFAHQKIQLIVKVFEICNQIFLDCFRNEIFPFFVVRNFQCLTKQPPLLWSSTLYPLHIAHIHIQRI